MLPLGPLLRRRPVVGPQVRPNLVTDRETYKAAVASNGRAGQTLLGRRHYLSAQRVQTPAVDRGTLKQLTAFLRRLPPSSTSLSVWPTTTPVFRQWPDARGRP